MGGIIKHGRCHMENVPDFRMLLKDAIESTGGGEVWYLGEADGRAGPGWVIREESFG